MSFKNRMLLDKDFALRHRSYTSSNTEKTHPHRIALKRKCQVPSRTYWDNLWRNAVHNAAAELKADYVNINDGAFFRTNETAAAVKARAEELWAKMNERNK